MGPLAWLCTVMVCIAIVPVLAGLFQYSLVALSIFDTHLERVTPHLPRVSILIPAWNEGAVIATTIDRLMALDYPADRIRVYVVDDASTDETPTTVIDKSKQYPGRVIHIRRVAGGEGKAHTLNYGLELLWRSDWTQAVLIMDADVIYSRTSLKQMSRHLSDPRVGAVTAYIKEGSGAPNYVQRFVGFEYITATGASRRAQNVLGFLACLSGGAQLHSRENLLTIGGKIFSYTLAEDTFTTFRTQTTGRRAIFEPNALVYAEEPDSLVGLWKQRVRWARGNVQITRVFRKLWFQGRVHQQLGSIAMGMLWFSIFLMPIFQIGATIGLLGLLILDPPLAWTLFRSFWIIAGVTYITVTLVSYCVDTWSAGRTWLEGVLFPGLISLALIIYALWPPIADPLITALGIDARHPLAIAFQIFCYLWLSANMALAYASKELERREAPGWLVRSVLYLAGYGPFLCAVTFGAYIKEFVGADMKWDKTVKTGKVG